MPHIRGLKSHFIDSASFLNPMGRKLKAGVISQILSSHTASQFSMTCGIFRQVKETVLLRLKECNNAANLLHYCVFALGNK